MKRQIKKLNVKTTTVRQLDPKTDLRLVAGGNETNQQHQSTGICRTLTTNG